MSPPLRQREADSDRKCTTRDQPPAIPPEDQGEWAETAEHEQDCQPARRLRRQREVDDNPGSERDRQPENDPIILGRQSRRKERGRTSSRRKQSSNRYAQDGEVGDVALPRTTGSGSGSGAARAIDAHGRPVDKASHREHRL